MSDFIPSIRCLFAGWPASREEVHAFVQWVMEVRRHPEFKGEKEFHFDVRADKVVVLHLPSLRYVMTTKLQLFEFWPKKVDELDGIKD